MPRLVHVGGVSIPAPAYVGGQITTFYRFYVRFGYIAGIGLAVLAAAALAVLLRRKSYWVAAAAVVACIVELAARPHHDVERRQNPPDYVRWLAQQPRGIVAHYPQYTDKQPAIDLARSEHYNQRFHGQPHYTVFGGGYGLTREHAIRVFTRYVTDPGTPSVLAAERVRYVVLHDDVYRAQGETPPVLGSPDFAALARFGDVRVFRVMSPPANVDKVLADNAAAIAATQGLGAADVSFGEGFSPTAAGDTRMPGQAAHMSITNDGLAKSFELRLRLSSVAAANVSLHRNGELLGTTITPAGSEALLTGRLELPSGAADVEVRSSADGVVVHDVQAAPLADVSTRLNQS